MPDRPGAPPRAWQRMLSGRRLDLLDPSPLDIEVEDIAHGLARVARWNGQTFGDHAFSVAQHSLLVERIMRLQHEACTPRDRLATMLHDAPEYVIGDLISPFKAVIDTAYRQVEERLHGAVRLRFGLPAQLSMTLLARIKKADQAAAYFEAVAPCRVHRCGRRTIFRQARRDQHRRNREYARSVAGEACRIALSEGIQGRRKGRCGRASMSAIVVCSLSRLAETVAAYRASHIVTLINSDTMFSRPPVVPAANHLHVGIHDISEPMEGMVLPGAGACARIPSTSPTGGTGRRRWSCIALPGSAARPPRRSPIFCAARPDLDEAEIALRLRKRSPEATPNVRLVAIADEILGRSGRMVRAIETIGRGTEAMEGTTFAFRLDE